MIEKKKLRVRKGPRTEPAGTQKIAHRETVAPARGTKAHTQHATEADRRQRTQASRLRRGQEGAGPGVRERQPGCASRQNAKRQGKETQGKWEGGSRNGEGLAERQARE